jgi:two-component sensor histidine kinase/putative methionine-R-sulfoxide reductase with GAF domain/HAMP domain-containing protein
VSLLSGGLVLFSYIRTQQEAVAVNLHTVAQDAAQVVSGFFQDKFSALETLATLSAPVVLERAANKDNLESLLGLQPAFRQLAILSNQGQVVATSSRLSGMAFEGLTSRLSAEMLSQLRADGRAISPVYVDNSTSEPLVLLAVPVKNAFGEVQGTLLAEVNLKFMWDVVDQLRVGDSGIAYVVDRGGNLIAYRDTARVLRGDNVKSLYLVNEFVNDRANLSPNALNLVSGIRNDVVVGAMFPLRSPDWAVVAELPWTEGYRSIIGIGITSLFIVFAISLLAGLVGLYLARRLTKPLVNLTQTATRITAGELNLQAEVTGPTEISGLATAFNNMTTRLRETLAGLEQRVAERTRALETSRDELEKTNLTLQANSSYLAALNETSSGLMGRLDTNELLNAIVVRASRLVNTDSGYLYLQDSDEAVMEMRVGTGLYANLVGAHAKRGVGLAGTVWSDGRALAIDDYQNWDGRLSGAGREVIQSVVGVPLKAADKVIGVIGLAYTEPGRKFGETEIQILNRFAQLAEIALENARLFEQTQAALTQSEQQARILYRLNRTSTEISAARTFDQVVQIATHAVQEILSPDRIAVTMVMPDQANFQVYAVEGEAGVMPVGRTMPLAGTMLAEALRERRVKYAPDVTLEYNNPGAMAHLIQQGLRAVINAPLLFDDAAPGALNVSSKTPDKFSAQDVSFVEQIAALASASLQKLRLLEQTQNALSETELLYRATRDLSNASDLPSLLNVAMVFGQGQNFSGVLLALEDSMQDPQAPQFVLHSVMAQGDEIIVAPPTPTHEPWYIPETAYTYAEGQQVLVVTDVANDATRLPTHARQVFEKMGAFAIASAMLRFGDGSMGFLTFTGPEPIAAAPEVLLPRIAAFGNQFGTALENQRLYEQTQLALAEARRAAEREHEASEQILSLNRRLTGEGWQEYLETQTGTVWVEDAIPTLNGEHSELPELEHAAETGGLVISNENGHSALALPIVVRGHVIGTVGLQDLDASQEWSEERIGLVNDVVQSLGLALDNARLYSESQRRVTELDALNRISQAVTSELDLESLLSIIGEQVRQIFDVENTYVALYDRETQMISLPYFVNDGKRVTVDPIRFGEGLTSEIIRMRRPLLLNQNSDATMAQLGAKVFGNPAQSYLGVPILVGEEVTGVISIQSTLREEAFDQDNVRLLKTIAATVGAAIQNAQLYGAMEQEVQERKRAEEEIKLSLREKEVLLKEIHHRVKNNLQIITSLLNLQSAQIKDPEALLMFRESQARVRSMALIHEKLYQSKDLARIDFAGYVRELMVYLFRSYTVNPDQIQTELDTSDIYLGIDTAIPCGLIISELVTNSMKYAFPDGKRGHLYVGLQELPDGNLVLKVADDGVGFADDFDWRESDSLGLQLVSTLTAQLHGTMQVSGRNGACFTLTFPG